MFFYLYEPWFAVAPLALFLILMWRERGKNQRMVASIAATAVAEYARAIKSGKSEREAKKVSMESINGHWSDDAQLADSPLHMHISFHLEHAGLIRSMREDSSPLHSQYFKQSEELKREYRSL